MRALQLVFSILLLGLAGCGFQPLYAERTGGADVVASLAEIDIPEAETRLGQIIRNDLISSMRPAGSTEGGGKYRLMLKPDSKSSSVIANTLPAVTRRSMLVTVEFELFDG
ncbi:MAG: hypothetical protein FJX63_05685, partial [Alphaproteobacteria bacterium]|nr:hypothetical protein [Alphaproteobacteria bacterium]